MRNEEPVSTVNRTEFLKTCLKMDLPLSTVAQMTMDMRGKSDTEKEEMAAELIKKLNQPDEEDK